MAPSALAGFRDTGIGTDTVTYADFIFQRVASSNGSFIEFLQAYGKDEFFGIEFGYALLNYVLSLFSDSVNWLYFFTNFAVIIFVYLTAYDNRKKAQMWMVMALYLLLFYNSSLNIMRQSIAVAMALYAFKYIENRQWFKSLLWLVIIYLTHSSGIFFAIFLVIYKISFLKNRRASVWLQVLFLASTSLFFIAFSTVLNLLTVVSDNFSKYDELYSNEGKTVVVKNLILLYVIFLIIIFLLRKYVPKDQLRNTDFYMYLKITGLIFFLTSIISVTTSRVSWYINVLDCIIIPRMLYEFSKKGGRVTELIAIIVVLLALGIWYWNIAFLNAAETYPYKSSILGL
ncbi:EpsG family protein [Flavobacterium psychrotrophum]|uniref:EpsG family protein n=1 Tax=Flavobacterium psychrotrophum TaxID=2294119 RepID=UPI0013C413AA|nr:EpsG family protein [Flavobacterium psychrotrophum]